MERIIATYFIETPLPVEKAAGALVTGGTTNGQGGFAMRATSVGADRFYSRYGNPTVRGFEDAIARLEGAEAARAFASGMGAISGVILGICSTDCTPSSGADLILSRPSFGSIGPPGARSHPRSRTGSGLG